MSKALARWMSVLASIRTALSGEYSVSLIHGAGFPESLRNPSNHWQTSLR